MLANDKTLLKTSENQQVYALTEKWVTHIDTQCVNILEQTSSSSQRTEEKQNPCKPEVFEHDGKTLRL